MILVGLLYPPSPTRVPSAPPDTMFGRAGLALREHGIEVLLGAEAEHGELIGQVPTPTGWQPRRGRPLALVHRFTDQRRPAAWSHLRTELAGLPMTNPHSLVELCRDKLALQQHLEGAGMDMPPVVHTHLAAALEDWGTAFLKPRFGAFGEGVQRVRAGHPMPTEGSWVLQRAVEPPGGWAGQCCRVLVQRDPAEGWMVLPGALRRDQHDPVVNRARGAEVVLASANLPEDTLCSMHRQSLEAAAVLSRHSPHAGELGLDFVIDRAQRPWLIEINGKPGGRLEALAESDPHRMAAILQSVAERPIRWAASLPQRDA